MLWATAAVSFVVRLGNTKIYTSKVYDMRKGESNGGIRLEQEVPLCGDIKIEFYHHQRWGTKVGVLGALSSFLRQRALNKGAGC